MAAVLILTSALAKAGPMSTAGQFEVSPTGAATYTIPIQVPPGTAGIEPKLSLVYNSQSGNGLLGVGWSLSGLSAITRCPRTLAQDGVRGDVNYDMNDRFCIDGQRLMVVNGSYGADGAEYRTERDSFSRINSYGSAGNGPAWFKVWTKSGQVLEYGNTDDSRIEAQGKTTARAWALNKIDDTDGNYLTVTYTEDNVNGDYYPTRIDYTGNAAANRSPARSVSFDYESRPDATPLYQGGSLVMNTVRLARVSAYVDGTLARTLRMTYGMAPSTGRQRLVEVTECAINGNTTACLPSTNLGWSDQALGFNGYTQWGTGFTPNDQLGDFNGDGKTDAVQFGNGNAYVWLSTGSGFTPWSVWGSGFSTSGKLGDFNGDGKTDVINLSSNGNGYVWLSTGSGFTPWAVWGTGFTPSDQLGDFNGDGRTDVIQFGNGYAYVWLSTGNGFTPWSVWGSGFSTRAKLGDFNGDGKTDVIDLNSNGNGYVWLSTGNGFTPWAVWGTGFTPNDLLGDFNGDGKTDVIQFGNGYAYVWLSTGTGFTPWRVWGSGFSTSGKLGDFNGDGKTDVIDLNANGNGYVWLSTGNAFSPWAVWGTGFTPNDQLGDFNGDGTTDVVQFGKFGNGNGYVWLTMGPHADLATSVTSGAGATTTIAYKPIPDPTVYTKDEAGSYPVQNIQSSIYVVSQVRADNGIGGVLATNHQYGGLKAEVGTGRGLLGFGWTQVTNIGTGVSFKTTYRQDWPYVGLPSAVTKSLAGSGNGGVLSQTTYSYGCLNPQLNASCAMAVGNTYFPYVSQSVESGYDLSGAAVPTVATTNAFDQYGNATQVSVTSSDGFSKTTSNTYNNDTTNWHLGRLLRSQVQSVAP